MAMGLGLYRKGLKNVIYIGTENFHAQGIFIPYNYRQPNLRVFSLHGEAMWVIELILKDFFFVWDLRLPFTLERFKISKLRFSQKINIH